QIIGEKRGAADPEHGCNRRADTQPLPFRRAPARAVSRMANTRSMTTTSAGHRASRSDGRKERKQPKEYDAGCNGEKSILGYLSYGAPKNVFPAFPWDTPGRNCLSPAPRLRSPFILAAQRLIAALLHTK